MFLCVTLLILHNLMESQSERVVGPDAPLVASAGEDLILPCYINPSTSAVGMRVEWFKLDKVNSLVHLYEDREDKSDSQADSYKRRTSLFKDELQKGNASLRLSSLRVSDEGKYKCFIEDKSWFDDTTVSVNVKAQGSHLVITMESYDNSGGINLMCESKGWNPEPKVNWLDRQGDPLPAEETQIHRETEGFNVKRRITVHDYSDSNKFYCRFEQPDHMKEAEVIINGKVFDTWKVAVGISFSTCLFTVAWIVIAVIWYKKVMQRRMMERVVKEIKEFAGPQTQRMESVLGDKKKSAEDVTLDPDTAHPNLRVSEDGKQVTCGDTPQNLPDTLERFDDCIHLVGKESFSSKNFYYEVQVSGKTAWILGVMKEGSNRKGIVTLTPQNGFWTLELKNKNEYKAHAGTGVFTEVLLTLRQKAEQVGVFVDYNNGQVSFYDVKSSSHIYSFTNQSFAGAKLYPFFSPQYREG
ncbi:butyrophilin subfamily 1 member A1-like isoform X1, partial [Clarias magur]